MIQYHKQHPEFLGDALEPLMNLSEQFPSKIIFPSQRIIRLGFVLPDVPSQINQSRISYGNLFKETVYMPLPVKNALQQAA